MVLRLRSELMELHIRNIGQGIPFVKAATNRRAAYFWITTKPRLAPVLLSVVFIA